MNDMSSLRSTDMLAGNSRDSRADGAETVDAGRSLQQPASTVLTESSDDLIHFSVCSLFIVARAG